MCDTVPIESLHNYSTMLVQYTPQALSLLLRPPKVALERKPYKPSSCQSRAVVQLSRDRLALRFGPGLNETGVSENWGYLILGSLQ